MITEMVIDSLEQIVLSQLLMKELNNKMPKLVEWKIKYQNKEIDHIDYYAGYADSVFALESLLNKANIHFNTSYSGSKNHYPNLRFTNTGYLISLKDQGYIV